MKRVALETAAELLDFDARLGMEQRAKAQLEGTVALHNILCDHRVGYLADEVGMGKTLVALGVVALVRHFQPSARILVIAPRENIQEKWMKEVRTFVAHNVRFADLRVRDPDGRPSCDLVKCDSLLDLLRKTQTTSGGGIFFSRMTSFSLGLKSGDGEERWVEELRELLPWMKGRAFARQGGKVDFKDKLAKAVRDGLPHFDLVIVDEGHNLKHGFHDHAAARNRVMSFAMGRDGEQRAGRVLFLSATPLEESYTQLWNQLDVFGLGGAFEALKDPEIFDDDKKEIARRFLIRRVAGLKAGGRSLTKNQYRREWRGGGVAEHDEPIRITDPRERLTLALVQKKVAEIIGDPKFGNSFQIGMLASFESLSPTVAKKKAADSAEEAGNFDGSEQTEDQREREGIDVRGVNRLAVSYRNRFHAEMPHPKMDALCSQLSDAWKTGRKALVFVRRIASVRDLKRKLDERYDEWLAGALKSKLPESLSERIGELFEEYRRERNEHRQHDGDAGAVGAGTSGSDDQATKDHFYSWFFRGDKADDLIGTGRRFQDFRGARSTCELWFEENHAARLLECGPGEVRQRLCATLRVEMEELDRLLEPLYLKRLSSSEAKRKEKFEAIQGAAIELLAHHDWSRRQEALAALHLRFSSGERVTRSLPTTRKEASELLETPTFFTHLRLERWKDLREAIWPAPCGDGRKAFIESELRGEMLSAAARLGHGLIDFYAVHARPAPDGDEITPFLEMLDGQRMVPPHERGWGALDELREIACHFDLILDVNAPEVRGDDFPKARQIFGTLLGRQQPVGGMSGGVNKTLVKQFRMPGYPFVMICTDVLQEGEDLHTFCAEVHHYGIAWTPSSMEQRTGRVDRVKSLAERRLEHPHDPSAHDKLQVHYPHLQGTVETLQVRRVLERMNTFLKLMHEGLKAPDMVDNRVYVDREILQSRSAIPVIDGELKSAFPVGEAHLRGTRRALEKTAVEAERGYQRFLSLREMPGVDWENGDGGGEEGKLYGSRRMPSGRQQPFLLRFQALDGREIVRCVSPVGRVKDRYETIGEIAGRVRSAGTRVAIIETLRTGEHTYDVTTEAEVLFSGPRETKTRVTALIERVTDSADFLERELEGMNVDRPLATFREDLKYE